jgi:isoamylase
MVMDSLRHWVTSFHVDGFRFDLCATLGREPQGFDPGAGFFDALSQDPVLAGVKLIAEPWDIGPGGYQLGNHPPGFAEWNDQFRDGIRRFWRGDAGQRPSIAARLAGSADIFSHRGRRAWVSVNFVASHDGFTLQDAVSYVDRHNDANGEANHDGHPANFSSNWGSEGPTADPAINLVRDRVARAMLATVFLAAGTPMLLAGDEFGRTQGGNNNAYCQDNEISWIDWRLAAAAPGAELIDYVARLAAIRREHEVLRNPVFMHGRAYPAPGIADMAWFDEAGETLSVEAWNDHKQRTLVLRRAMSCSQGKIAILTFLLNPTGEQRLFHLPPPHVPTRILIDSASVSLEARDVAGQELMVVEHSAMLLHAEYGKAEG